MLKNITVLLITAAILFAACDQSEPEQQLPPDGDGVAHFAEITVGATGDFTTINEALTSIRAMDRPNNATAGQVIVWIEPGNYEEMLLIDRPNITFRNTSPSPSLALLNEGVDIDGYAVRITSYYGHGYNYASMGSDFRWNAELAADTDRPDSELTVNPGGSSATWWNATVVVDSVGFEAFDIIFENSFNQYISAREAADRLVSTGGPARPTDVDNTDVQSRQTPANFVERAAAIAMTHNADRTYFNNCRFVGRQDTFYVGRGRTAVNGGILMGSIDPIFGPGIVVFNHTEIMMNVSDASNDVPVLTAAQQSPVAANPIPRGFLFYNTSITSTTPGVDTASEQVSKPGHFGRPWLANTSETAFVNTTIGIAGNGQSLILPVGWRHDLGGQANAFEYGTIELAEVDNSNARAGWAVALPTPSVNGVPLTPASFLGDWRPF